MSILEYNGAAIIAMAGKDCVAIAADTRLGVQAQTVACDFRKVFKMNDRLFVGLGGLATDVQTVDQLLKFRQNLYELREERQMSPKVFSNVLSNILYEKRFGPYFIEPIVAGLDENNKPFLSGMDLIGAPVYTDDFVVTGTALPGQLLADRHVIDQIVLRLVLFDVALQALDQIFLQLIELPVHAQVEHEQHTA